MHVLALMPRVSRRWIATLAALAALVIAGAVSPVAAQQDPGTPGPPSGAGVVPEVVGGNPTCGTLDPGTTEFKVEPVVDGTFTQGPLTVTIDVTDSTFNWSSNIPISSVFVKGGPGGNLYVYDPPATSDTGLHAPINPQNQQPHGLSHISFCFSPEVPETTTTTAAPEVTPTTAAPKVTPTAPAPVRAAPIFTG
jgi:hypothetical protein